MRDYSIERENAEMGEYRIEFLDQNIKGKGYGAGSHVHPAVELLYFVSGEYLVCVDERTFSVGEGDMVLVRSNVIHSTEALRGSGGLYYVLKVHPSLIFEFFANRESPVGAMPFLQNSREAVVHVSRAEMPLAVERIWREMIADWEEPDELLYIAQRARAATLLVALLRTALKSQKVHAEVSEHNLGRIYESLCFINGHYAEDITALDCAACVHMSYSHFAKLFRAVTGKTVKEYITAVRLSQASNLLLSTDMSVTEVALACGYKSVSYFISEYRRNKGVTPRAVRTERGMT